MNSEILKAILTSVAITLTIGAVAFASLISLAMFPQFAVPFLGVSVLFALVHTIRMDI